MEAGGAKKNMRHFGFVILALSVFLVQGCAELEELRKANKRQAITVRDQMSELDKLRSELDTANKVNSVYESRVQTDEEEKNRLRTDLEKLALSIGDGAVVRDSAEGPMIQLPETILFDSGLAKLKTKGEVALEKIAKHLTSRPSAIVRTLLC